jgi:hypothetical protein
MRRILTDHARRRAYVKHGGGVRHVVLDDVPDIVAPATSSSRWTRRSRSSRASTRSWPNRRAALLRRTGASGDRERARDLERHGGAPFRIAKAWLYRRLKTEGSAVEHERWRRIETLFDEATGLPPARADAFVL